MSDSTGQDIANVSQLVLNEARVKEAVANLQKKVPAEVLFEQKHPPGHGRKHESPAFVKAEGQLVDALAISLQEAGISGAPSSRDLTDSSASRKPPRNEAAANFEAETIRKSVAAVEPGFAAGSSQNASQSKFKSRGKGL
jgi:hypothetical protein